VFFTHTHGQHPKKDNTIINIANVKVTHEYVVSKVPICLSTTVWFDNWRVGFCFLLL